MIVVLTASLVISAPQLAAKAPEDKPGSLNQEELMAFEKAIAPYSAKARESYPEAKERFLAGLPSGYSFLITTRLHDEDGKWEQVFIAVQRIEDGKVIGKISNNLNLVKGFKRGQKYTFPESELLDWVIVSPDGKEEGNFVGNFLDTFKP